MKLELFTSKKRVRQLQDDAAKSVRVSSLTIDFIRQLLKGEDKTTIDDDLRTMPIGKELQNLRDHLLTISLKEKERNWLNVGLAQFADILRNKKSLELKKLADEILSSLIHYVNANQGAIFIYEDDVKGDEHLNMISCYAYDRKKFLERRIAPGEGLAGQCFLEKETVYIKQAPPNYLTITSGLGQAGPREILITPMLINENIYGVLELASFQEFEPYKVEFIEKLSENIASTIKNVRENEKIVTLLNASQQQAEELRAQEEEMRQNMEELQATQEEMQRKTDEVTRTSAEMISIRNGINATMATIEFTPTAQVITANQNFLTAMKYKIEDIRGKHHRTFVPAEILQSEEYQTFWTRLAAGESITGIFKRKAADGSVIWLNAIYNPIFNQNQEVIKVVKYATDITAQQELIAESNGMLSGINATMATIEFTPEGEIIKANSIFLKAMGYQLSELKGRHHRMFVPKQIHENADYKTFWNRLASGEPITGVFERVNSFGEPVWLSAIYNPIKNANGDVIKVAKMATVTTVDQNVTREIKVSAN
jgi:PAS domain S-box-containing protein